MNCLKQIKKINNLNILGFESEQARTQFSAFGVEHGGVYE